MSIKPISGSQICGQSPYGPACWILINSLARLYSLRPRQARRLCCRVRGDVSCEDHNERKLTIRLRDFYPPHPHVKSAITSTTTGSLRSTNEFKRQLNFLDKAEAAGHTVIRGDVDEERRRLGVSLVIMNGGVKGNEGGLMDEEIFGPVLPIIPVDVSWPARRVSVS